MADTCESVRLELSINGEVVATAGTGAFGVLTGIVSWVRRSPDQMPKEVQDHVDMDRRTGPPEELSVELGGLDSVAAEHLKWVNGHGLSVGDEVTFRVLAPGQVDEAPRAEELRGSGQEDS